MPTFAPSTAATPLATTPATRFSLRAWFNRTFVVDLSGLDQLDLGDALEFETHVAGLFERGSYASAQ
ncbi:MAG: hypothetical protein RhofKO_11460 [Rhodothermales bacterium]